MQYFESIAILIAKFQSIAISIAKFQKYCNTLQYYWNHPYIQVKLTTHPFVNCRLLFFGEIINLVVVQLFVSWYQLFVFNSSYRQLISLNTRVISSGLILSVFDIVDLGGVEPLISWRLSLISLVVESVSSIFRIDDSFIV